MSDLKPAARIRDPELLRQFRAEHRGMPCEACGVERGQGAHHLVNRSQGGDDVVGNLAWLCGTGTTGCHGKIQEWNLHLRVALRQAMTEEQVKYVTSKVGSGRLDRLYPTGSPAPNVVN